MHFFKLPNVIIIWFIIFRKRTCQVLQLKSQKLHKKTNSPPQLMSTSKAKILIPLNQFCNLRSAHSELKFRKKSIFAGQKKTHFLTFSKAQKHIFCYFKNGKKSIFVPEKSPKIAFLVVLNFFLVQKFIFCHI